MNAATDNPLIFEDGAKIISGGNFHGQPIAFAMDFLKVAASLRIFLNAVSNGL